MASIVSLQSFLNICVATGIAPNTGTPLPFVSYGLTSLVSLYLGMGLVLNVGIQSSAYNKEIRKKSVNQKEDYLKAASLDYGVGDTVRHIKFGVGIVRDIVEGGRDYEVTVDFDKVGVKKMFAGFAKLKKI